MSHIDELRCCLGALWCGLCETIFFGLKIGRKDSKTGRGYRSGLIKQHILVKFHQKKLKELSENDPFKTEISEIETINSEISQTHRSDVFFCPTTQK